MKVGLKIASVLFLFSIFSAAPARAASPAFVVVGYGDDLYRIAAQFGTRADELARANKLPSVNFVYVGQIIFIPETFTDTAALSSANAAAPIVQVYTVRYGDTLYALATRFGTTIQAVMNANGIRNPNFIYSGQRLNIPNKNNPSGTQISASSSTASS
ncbi:MAG: LysM peptidoglycan-binding domain-containing protein, partial [Chloroflexi bacterium]|nr:LysM peptidoglycan-binding domain-containing protein [Chloroflexota bacterium]